MALLGSNAPQGLVVLSLALVAARALMSYVQALQDNDVQEGKKREGHNGSMNGHLDPKASGVENDAGKIFCTLNLILP